MHGVHLAPGGVPLRMRRVALMRSVLSYGVLCTGLAFGVQAFFPGAFHSIGLSLSSLRSAADEAQTAPDIVDAREVNHLASFSPGSRLSAAAQDHRGRMDVLAFLSSQFAGLGERTAAEPPPRDVALAPWRSAVVPATKVASGLPEGAKRVARIRELQRELKRVGCYDGSIDGSWGPASKRAMLAFIERVNATLPLNESDDILLLLVKGQAAGTCSVVCPLGQTLSQDRCVPDSILAYADKHPKSREATRVAEAKSLPAPTTSIWPPPAASSRDWSIAGRMGIGGPEIAERPTGLSKVATAEPPAEPQPGTVSITASPHTGNASEGASTGDAGQWPPAANTDTAAPAPSKPSTATPRRSRSAERRERRPRGSGYGTSGYKSVQRLFEHPLGRL